jgi:hypothetical protein
MHGCSASKVGRALAIVLLLGALGCGDARTQPSAQPAAETETGHFFDPATAATITGCVRWADEVPSVPPLIERPNIAGPLFDKESVAWPNPNAPVIDAMRAVRGAVVFLRGVESGRARPWDLPPVRVVQQGKQFHIHQGDGDGTVGFVRRGDAVELVSADLEFYSLHASGAAYFTLAFPDADRPRARRLTNSGIVELSSAAGHFWMRGYLFVDDHSHYTRSDAAGRFRLTNVPPGQCQVVCWLPNWREERHERDPETSRITRLFFRPPLESVRSVTVGSKETATVDFTMP